MKFLGRWGMLETLDTSLNLDISIYICTGTYLVYFWTNLHDTTLFSTFFYYEEALLSLRPPGGERGVKTLVTVGQNQLFSKIRMS